MNAEDLAKLKAHAADLEQQLHVTKAIIKRAEQSQSGAGPAQASLPLGPALHNLLLLSDSALPLGSFAYSSGLESFLAHHKAASATHSSTQNGDSAKRSSYSLFQQFLRLSIQSMAHTQIPYVLAGFRDPYALMDLDNDIDASTPCIVQRRASIAQGRALLSVYEKAFSIPAKMQFSESFEPSAALATFAKDLRTSSTSALDIKVNGHLAPIWGVVALSLGLTLEDAAYVFLLNHAKAVVSAAVRSSVMGPYQAHSTLASQELQGMVKVALEKVWFMKPEDAAQSVPSMDLWNGRHELLYSRIFNS